MIVKPATEDDWEAFGLLRLASLREPDAPHAASLGREEGFRESHWRMRLRGGMYLLAWTDDESQAIGLVGLMLEPGAPTDERLVFSLWVRPSERRQGIGRALLRAATHWAHVDDAHTVSAWITENSEPAMALFGAAGFSPTGERVRLPRNPDRIEARWSLQVGGDERALPQQRAGE